MKAYVEFQVKRTQNSMSSMGVLMLTKAEGADTNEKGKEISSNNTSDEALNRSFASEEPTVALHSCKAHFVPYTILIKEPRREWNAVEALACFSFQGPFLLRLYRVLEVDLG